LPGPSSSGDSCAKRSSAVSASCGPLEVDQDLREVRGEAARLELRVGAAQERDRLLEAAEPLEQARRRADPGPEERARAERLRDALERLLEPVLLLEHRRVLDRDPRAVGAERRGLAQPLLGGLEVAKASGDRGGEREPVGAHLDRSGARQLALAHEAPRREGAAERQHRARAVVVRLGVGWRRAVGAQVEREAEPRRSERHRETPGEDALRRLCPGRERAPRLRGRPRLQVAPGLHVDPDRCDRWVLRGPPPAASAGWRL
jgi:hypothetical protein